MEELEGVSNSQMDWRRLSKDDDIEDSDVEMGNGDSPSKKASKKASKKESKRKVEPVIGHKAMARIRKETGQEKDARRKAHEEQRRELYPKHRRR